MRVCGPLFVHLECTYTYVVLEHVHPSKRVMEASSIRLMVALARAFVFALRVAESAPHLFRSTVVRRPLAPCVFFHSTNIQTRRMTVNGWWVSSQIDVKRGKSASILRCFRILEIRLSQTNCQTKQRCRDNTNCCDGVAGEGEGVWERFHFPRCGPESAAPCLTSASRVSAACMKQMLQRSSSHQSCGCCSLLR